METISRAEHLPIRTTPRNKKTLAEAARLRNMSVSQFLLQLDLPVAEEILAKHQVAERAEVQTIFNLDAQAWSEFARLLDGPPRELPGLKKLLASKPVWEA